MTDSELEPTGERLLPEHHGGQLVHAEHLARYRLAAQLAPGRRVLDCACGEGYGAALMAAAGAKSVTAADIDQATVDHVRDRYGIDAHRADVRCLPFEDGAFDLVVSFETIEHVQEPERALDELARVRAPGRPAADLHPERGGVPGGERVPRARVRPRRVRWPCCASASPRSGCCTSTTG